MRWKVATGFVEETHARLDTPTFGLDPPVQIPTEFPELIDAPTKSPPTSHVERWSVHSPTPPRRPGGCRDLPPGLGGKHTEWQRTTRNWEDSDGPYKGETEDEYDV